MRLARCTPTRRCLVDIGYSFAPPQCMRGGVRWQVARVSLSSTCHRSARLRRRASPAATSHYQAAERAAAAAGLLYPDGRPSFQAPLRAAPPTQYRTPEWQGLVPGVAGNPTVAHGAPRLRREACTSHLAHRSSDHAPPTMHRTAAQLPSTSQPTAHVRHSRPPMSSQEPQPKPGRPDPTIPGAPPPLTRTRT